MARLTKFADAFFYSFPIQLLLNNFKRNQVLLLCWIILFAMVTGNFGKYLGIAYRLLPLSLIHLINSALTTEFFPSPSWSPISTRWCAFRLTMDTLLPAN